MSDGVVEKYIERVEKLRQRNQSRLTREDLESIAREVGLSDADLAAVDEHVQSHYERGNGYVDHGLWDDAIAEFEEAFALAPTRVHIVYALANAHYGRAQAADSESDRQRALQLAKECLELDSQYQPAFTLLSQIRSLEIKPVAPVTAPPANAPPDQAAKVRGIIIVGAAFAVLIGGIVPVLMFSTGDQSTDPETVEIPKKPAVVERVSSAASDSAFRIGESEGKTIEPIASPQGRGLRLDVSKSDHNVYKDKAYYAIHALLENESERQFEEIKAEFTLVGADGAPLQTHMAELHSSHDATLRPGDWSPYSTTISAPRDFDRVTVKIVSTNAQQALDYAAEKPVELTFVTEVPDNLKLEVRERSSAVSSADYFQAEWAFQNTGTGYIGDLKVECIVYGVGGEELGRRDWLVVYSSTPRMKPGQIWPESTIQKVEKPVERYELRVLQIR